MSEPKIAGNDPNAATAEGGGERPSAAGSPATWKPGRPVRLETERFLVRSLTPADVTDRYVGWFHDPKVMDYVAMPRGLTRKQLVKYVESFDNVSRFNLGIFTKETGLLIGYYTAECSPTSKVATLTVVIGDRDYWGKRAAVRGAAVVMDFLFETLGAHKLVGRVYSGNRSAIALNKLGGLREEGVLREHEWVPPDGWRDIVLMGLLREEWRAGLARRREKYKGTSTAGPPVVSSRLDEEWDEQHRWILQPRWLAMRRFDRLVENEFLSEDEQAARRRRGLARMIRFAFAEVPYYRDLAERLRLAPAELEDTESLPRLPVLTRSDLQRLGKRLCPGTLPKGERQVWEYRSSGTTGIPAQVFRTATSAVFSNVALSQRQLRWFRFDPARRFAAIRKPVEMPPGRDGKPVLRDGTFHALAWQYVGEYFQTGPFVGFGITNSIEEQVEWLARHDPDYLLSWSNNLDHLALTIREQAGTASLRALLGIAEQITPGMRRRIEDSFGVPLHENYGLNEIGIVAARCPEGGRYHVHAEFCLVEIVDADGQPCAPGEVGRLVVTGLTNPAMPLIRYDSGDLAEVVDGPCPCGRTLPSFGAVVGRSRHFAYCPPGTLARVEAVDDAIDELPLALVRKLRRYQLHQFRDDSFELRVVAAETLSGKFEKPITAAWRAQVGGKGPPITIRQVDEIPSSPSGKFQKFTSDFIPADPGEEPPAAPAPAGASLPGEAPESG
ncbi:MAG: GNAT family N-acetyltransferase [Alphaproteobacteria bacterium]